MIKALELLERIENVTSDERLIKRVVRNKKVQKRIVCKKGFKNVGGICVPVKSTERRLRKIGAKKAARKKRSVMKRIIAKRSRSLKVRKSMGLK